MSTNEPAVPVSALLALLARWERWQANAEAEGLEAVGRTVWLARHDLTVVAEKYAPIPGFASDLEVCDAQEHATEAEYRACPICNPPFPAS